MTRRVDATADQLREALTGLPAFRPRWPWISGDLQTLRNTVRRHFGLTDPSAPTGGERLWMALDDGTGDRLALLYDRPPLRNANRPLSILIHGLTGCEDTLYMQCLTAHLLASGGPVLRVNLRGAGPSRPTSQQQYHAGRSEDLRIILGRLAGVLPEPIPVPGILLVGVSLGANMLLKFLGEGAIPAAVTGAVAVSAPIGLAATSRRMCAPRNAVYHRFMLDRMRREALAAPVVSEAERTAVRQARTVYEFDEVFVAPRNGFADADEYYSKNSAENFLSRITLPTVILHADDDPWIEMTAYDRVPFHQHPTLVPVITQGGGHVGFHAAGSTHPHNWLTQLVDIVAQTLGNATPLDQPADRSSSFAAKGAA